MLSWMILVLYPNVVLIQAWQILIPLSRAEHGGGNPVK